MRVVLILLLFSCNPHRDDVGTYQAVIDYDSTDTIYEFEQYTLSDTLAITHQ